MDQRNPQQGHSVPHVLWRIDQVIEDPVPERDVQQAESHHDQAHHRAGAEGHLEAAVEALTGPLGGPGRGLGGRVHAQEPAQAAEEPTGQEGHRHEGVLDAEVGQDPEDDHQDHKDHGYDPVLPEQIGKGPLADVRGNLQHRGVACRCAHHLLVEVVGEDQGQHGPDRSDPPRRRGAGHREGCAGLIWLLGQGNRAPQEAGCRDTDDRLETAHCLLLSNQTL